MNFTVQRILFGRTSLLTDFFPVAGRRLLDTTFRAVFGSRQLSAAYERQNRRRMKRVKAFQRFLVISDTHIGDAVVMQSALAALRDFFPDSEIDYVINKAVAPLIVGNPDATEIIPFFSGGQFPSSADMAGIREILLKGRYDLTLNFSPFIERKDLVQQGEPFANFTSHGPVLVRNENDFTQINHFSYQTYQFVRGLLSMVAQPIRPELYPGSRITLSDEAVEGAGRFAREAGLAIGSPVIMVNPDSNSRFNLMPFDTQAALLGMLARDSTGDVTILLGAGHTEEGIGERLLDTIPSPLRSKFRIVPRSVPLDVFSALIDFADVFLTGDTGPLHLAAARRYSRSGRHKFRNRTAVLSFFGATMSRMSGYDSFQPGYLPANQDAPSWCYVAGSPCRNITCLNKMFKTCRTVRCFEHVDVAGLAQWVLSRVSDPR